MTEFEKKLIEEYDERVRSAFARGVQNGIQLAQQANKDIEAGKKITPSTFDQLVEAYDQRIDDAYQAGLTYNKSNPIGWMAIGTAIGVITMIGGYFALVV